MTPDTPQLPCTRAESCVIACADTWRDAGEVMVSPFGTIPALGARLAKSTFSPDLVLTDGEAALMVGAPPISMKAADLIREARVMAAEEGRSISALLTDRLETMVRDRKAFDKARRRALARLREGLDLQWTPPKSRDELHER